MSIDTVISELHSAQLAKGALTWWLRELSGLIPPALSTWLYRQEQPIELLLELNEVQLRANGSTMTIPTPPNPISNAVWCQHPDLVSFCQKHSGRVVDISIDDALLLKREVPFPKAARKSLRSIVELQFERIMPIQRDAVLLDMFISRDEKSESRIWTTIAAVPREPIERVIRHLARLGLPVREVGGRTAQPSVSFLFADNSARVRYKVRRISVALAISLLILSLSALVLCIQKMQNHVDFLILERDAASAEARHAEVLRRQVLSFLRSIELQHSLKDSVRPEHVLTKLSQLLPDHTWISSYDQTGRQVKLSGETANTSTIVGVLAAEPLFDDITSKATRLRRSTHSHVEQFTITFSLPPDGQKQSTVLENRGGQTD